MDQSAQRRPKRRLSSALFVMVIVAALVGIWQEQAIVDWYKLRGYQAPARIAQLADETTMTDYARKLYYVNRPQLITKSSFSSYCPTGTEQTVVLGCYTSGDRGIFLLDVENAELDGIEQVTAAHEMLHAGYDRLSDGERERLNVLLAHFYENELKNVTIKNVIDSYKKTEPDHLPDEIYAIFATQVDELPVELERHFRHYFTERAKVVAFYNEYEAAFTSRQKRIEAYDIQLSAWKAEINHRDQQVKRSRDALERKNQQLTEHQTSQRYEAYNAGVDEYNALVASYNAELQALKNLITAYNNTVELRNAIAFEERSLVEAISASPVGQ